MTWLTWRQHRWEAVSALAVLIALGGAVVILSIADSGLANDITRNCQPNSQGVASNFCGSLPAQFSASFQPKWWWIVVVGTVVPGLLGIFVGAPMIAREMENGTQLLAWTQGITRRRWFLCRVGLVLIGATAGAAALAAASQGWFNMQRDLGSTLGLSQWDGFEIGAPVVVAYTMFALALGIAAGAAIRRTVPAMAATLVGFIATRLAIALVARPNYIPPLTTRATLASLASQSGFAFPPGGSATTSAWDVGPIVMTDPAGHPILGGFCTGAGPGCLTQVTGIQQYQPGDRFWPFQGIEAAIFAVLAFALLALAYRLVMRIR